MPSWTICNKKNCWQEFEQKSNFFSKYNRCRKMGHFWGLFGVFSAPNYRRQNFFSLFGRKVSNTQKKFSPNFFLELEPPHSILAPKLLWLFENPKMDRKTRHVFGGAFRLFLIFFFFFLHIWNFQTIFFKKSNQFVHFWPLAAKH